MNFKKMMISAVTVLSLANLTACTSKDVSYSDKPEVMACRIIEGDNQ